VLSNCPINNTSSEQCAACCCVSPFNGLNNQHGHDPQCGRAQCDWCVMSALSCAPLVCFQHVVLYACSCTGHTLLSYPPCYSLHMEQNATQRPLSQLFLPSLCISWYLFSLISLCSNQWTFPLSLYKNINRLFLCSHHWSRCVCRCSM